MAPVSKARGAVLFLVCALVGASLLPVKDAGASASVGLVVFKGSGFGREVRDPFAARLKAHGSSAEVHVLTPTCDKVSRINSVRKLLAHGVGVLVVFGTCAAQDAAEATNKVPIVLLAGYDPTGGRPDRPAWMGNNVTGLSCRTSVPLLYENMHKTSPLETVGFLQCSDDDDGAAQLRDVQAVARSRDFQLIVANASGASAGQLARTFSPAQFVHVGWGCDPQVLGFDLERLGKPLVTQSPGLKGSGIVLSLAANAEAMIDEGAALAARLLKGERAANIPITEAKKVDFLVDLQEALALGLRIPFEVLQANR
jgi:putative ABC transport system substrate-binding protein